MKTRLRFGFFYILTAVLLTAVLLATGIASCGGGRSGEESNYGALEESNYGALVENLSEYFEVKEGRSKRFISKCLSESKSAGSLEEAREALFGGDGGALSPPPASTALANSPQAPSTGPKVRSGNQKNQRDAATYILSALADCKDFRKIGIRDYEENLVLIRNSNCSNRQLWQKFHTLILAGSQITSEDAEELGREFVYCIEYASQIIRVFEIAYNWFDKDCVYSASLIKGLEGEQVRLFAGSLFTEVGREKEYIASTKWELSNEDIINQLVDCINYSQIKKSLKIDKGIEDRESFEDCVKELSLKGLRDSSEYDGGSYNGMFINILHQVTDKIPLCK